MEYQSITSLAEQLKTPCLIMGLFQDEHFEETIKSLDALTKGWLIRQIKRGDIDGNKGQTLFLYDPPGLGVDRILLVGCGTYTDFKEKNYIEACQLAINTLKHSKIRQAISTLPALKVAHHDINWRMRQALLASDAALYHFNQFKTGKNKPVKPTLKKLELWAEESVDQVLVTAALAIARGTTLARDLANLPGNVCTPTLLAKQAKSLKKRHQDLEVEILDESDLEKLGMGAFLAVSKGSAEPGKMIIIKYYGGAKGDNPIVLVGKGITFDTGGISLKPSDKMDEMKFDMSGAASVMGTLSACAQMKLKRNVIGIMAAAENMPGGQATRPGDIVKTLSGQTVEILNTDAEGRLVLCDALTYAERFTPAVVIDIATLTGATIIALGHEVSALLGNDDQLNAALRLAGENSFDRVWELPLLEEYGDLLKSNFADMANIGGRAAGTITAASFLSRFTRKYRWAHLDIAGTAWVSGDKKGATGRPVPLLMEFLTQAQIPARP